MGAYWDSYLDSRDRLHARRQARKLRAVWLDGPDSEAARAARRPDPTYTPAVRRVVAWETGSGSSAVTLGTSDEAYDVAVSRIMHAPSPSADRFWRRYGNRGVAYRDRVTGRLAAWLRHQDESKGYR